MTDKRKLIKMLEYSSLRLQKKISKAKKQLTQNKEDENIPTKK